MIDYGRRFLDQAAPLSAGSHRDVVTYSVASGALRVVLNNGTPTTLKNPSQLKGYQGQGSSPSAILLQNNGIHFEIAINRSTAIGGSDPPTGR